jgi:hypothetical protein
MFILLYLLYDMQADVVYLLSDPGLRYLYYACRGGLEFPVSYLMSGPVTLGCPLLSETEVSWSRCGRT